MIFKGKKTLQITPTICQQPPTQPQPCGNHKNERLDAQHKQEYAASGTGQETSQKNQIGESEDPFLAQQFNQNLHLRSQQKVLTGQSNKHLGKNNLQAEMQDFRNYNIPLREQEGGIPAQLAQELLKLSTKEAKTRLSLYFPESKLQLAQMDEAILYKFLHNIVEINRHAELDNDNKVQFYPSSQQMIRVVSELLPALKNQIQTMSQWQLRKIFALTQVESRKQKKRAQFKFEVADKHPFQAKLKEKQAPSAIINFEELINIVRQQQPAMMEYFSSEEKLRQAYQEIQNKMIQIEASFRQKRRTQPGIAAYQSQQPQQQDQNLHNTTQQPKTHRVQGMGQSAEIKPQQTKEQSQHGSHVVVQSEPKPSNFSQNEKAGNQAEQSTQVVQDGKTRVMKRSYSKKLASDSQKQEQDSPPFQLEIGQLVKRNKCTTTELCPK